MAKYANGSIPEKISYCFSAEEDVNVGSTWDIVFNDVDEAHKNVTMKLHPTWAFDPNNEEIKSRTVREASQGQYDPNLRMIVPRPVQFESVENKPITGIKAVAFATYYNNHGFKAAIGNKLVELRTDVMMDTLLKAGVSPGGILNGEFIWAQLGKNTILVRIGSELHRLIVDFQNKKTAKPVGKNNLEFGGLYKDIRNNKAVFLGYVSTTSYKYIGGRTDYKMRKQTKPDFQYNQVFKKKNMLFYVINGYEGLDKCLAQMKDEHRNYGYRILQSHSYLEKIRDVEVPDDITLFLRKQARHEIKEKILEYTGAKQSYFKNDAWHLHDQVIRHSTMLNLYAFGKQPVELFDIKKFLLFS